MSFAELLESTKAQSSNQTPQTQPSLNTTTPQVVNNAGGFVFELDPMKRLDRFLILGSTNGSHYQTAKSLTGENLANIKALLKAGKGQDVVRRIVDISATGRARDNDYALMALAACFAEGDDETKLDARRALPHVARTGTHLMHFAGFANSMRGWGSSLKKAVRGWYESKSAEDIAFQAIKYRQRDGWSQKDLLRLAHPKAKTPQENAVYKYIVRSGEALSHEELQALPTIVHAFETAKHCDVSVLVPLIQDHRLSMEMIPNQHLKDVRVWEALYPNLGATALLRNLNKMSSINLIPQAGTSEIAKDIVNKLSSRDFLRRGKLHPMQILVAKKIYQAGRGDLGNLTWNPNQSIVAALENAFYESFELIQPSGASRFLAIDVSGSMNAATSMSTNVTCREAAAVMAMVSLKREPNSFIYGFDHQFRDLGINANDSLETVLKKTYSQRFGSTDCGLPMRWAKQNKIQVDQFEVYTDNETYIGPAHPFEELKNYRKAMHKPQAKLAVVGITSTGFTIADPKDAGMMDFVGFDTATPALLADFAAGRL